MLSRERRSYLVVAVVAFLIAHPPAASAQTAPLGGLTRLYEWPEETQNLVVNPSFEQLSLDSLSNWKLGSPSYWILDTATRHSGTRSLHLKNSHLSPYTPMASQELQLTPGWYNLRGFVKTNRAGSNASGSGGRISLWKGSSREATSVLAGTRDWTVMQHNSFLVQSASGASVRLEAYRKPNGDVYFDDLALHRLIPPFVEGFLLYPNYRGVLFQDRSQTIRVAVLPRPEVRGRTDSDFFVRLLLEHADGTDIVWADRTLPRNVWTTISLDASRAAAGRLRLRLLAFDSRTRAQLYEYPPYEIVKSPGSTRSTLKAYVDPDNTFVLNGQRRFPLGIYDTSGRSSVASYYEPRISKIAEAPIDLYLNYWLSGASGAELTALTTTLRKHGMSYLHTVNSWYQSSGSWPANSLCGGIAARDLGEAAFTMCKAKELANLPGMAGWYTADERTAGESARVFGQYLLLRKNDPDGVTFIAQNRPQEQSRWRDATDVMGVDPYPIYNIPEGQLSPLERVIDWVDQAEAGVQGSRPVWAVIQFFKFGGSGHWPTTNELRSMSYMAIIAGAKGLFYWSNGNNALESVTDPDLKEQYWQRLVKVTKEIKGLEPVLLAPDDPSVLTSYTNNSSVRLITRTVAGTRYILAVNRTPATVAAQFTLAKPATSATVRGESRTRPVTAGTFTDSFGPYAAHVYQIAAQ